ncbi:acyl-CoA dehydrogenase family protein [Streptomyces apocyni]|uniref:acyl-CoA dehydrogenase family protein n=1 Tax=Streptomyces apocyni TaxID=2654677 RepID=UPI0018D1D5BD|nr:acyl-CoA dehydrogenase family protein [Streptomyces apocyni]
MDLDWTPDQRDLYDRLRRLTAERETDETSGADPDWAVLAQAGVMALPIPEEYGGLGHSALTCAVGLEGLGYGCADTGLLVSAGAHTWAVEIPLLTYGTDEQRRAYLPALASGRSVGAHAITETGSGSDALAMEATARPKGGGYVLNGRKRFVTNAPDADVFLVYATLGTQFGFTGVTAFLVERGHPGLRVEPEHEKAGLVSCSWGQVVLDDCVVDASMRLGAEKQGSQIFATVMAWERTLLLAPLLGAMDRQIDDCVRRARTRRQFGRRIGSFQSVSNRIVDMQLRLETSRGLVRAAAWELDRAAGGKERGSALPELAKLHVSESAVATFEDAMQVFGGYGYTEGAGIARRLSDALGTRISSGTSDMQRDVVAAKLGLR